MTVLTLGELVDTLIAARRAGGFRYDGQARVLAQFVEHCRREGYADGSIIQEAVEGSRRTISSRRIVDAFRWRP